jgi:hypothetical protein
MIGQLGGWARGRAGCGKNQKIGNRKVATLQVMAARPKLTYRRETRLLALLVLGERFEPSCRAIGVSSTAVRKRAHRDAAFAQRLKTARAHRAARADEVATLTPAPDWHALAAQQEDPELWTLPDPWNE